MASRTVSIKEICRILAGDGLEPLSEMAVSKFVSDGMPKSDRGKYDVDRCTSWYLARLRTAAKKRDTEILSLDKEQTRLTAAKASQEELNLAERIGQLIPVQLYENQIALFVNTTKMALLNLPARLAGKVEGLSRAESKALMAAAVRGCLAEMARNGRTSHTAARPAADTVVPSRRKRPSKRVPAKKPGRSKR